MKILKIQRKNLLNMEMVVNYLNFVFLIEIKSKSKYRILNFVFQYIQNTKWHFGYMDYYIHALKHDDFEMNFSIIFRAAILTLPVSILDEEKKNKLNFYFHTSLWCLKRFYEGLKGHFQVLMIQN